MQLILPFRHLHVPDKHVQWLAQANAADFDEKKFHFYPFKTRFLRSHAVSDGVDLQTIVKKCWCGDGIWRGRDDTLPRRLWEPCDRCGGTGIHATHKVVLLRWLIGGKIFHEPSGWKEHAQYLSPQVYRTRFEGLIKHAPVPARTGRMAMDRLLLRYEPEVFLRLWYARWRNWQHHQALKWRWQVNNQIRHVNQLLSRRAAGEIPF